MALRPEVEQWFRENMGRDISPSSEMLPPEDPSILNRLTKDVIGPNATFWPTEKTRQGPAAPPPSAPELQPPGDPFSAILSMVKPEWYDALSKPVPGANPEAPSAISAGQNIMMAAGGIPNARGSASRAAVRDPGYVSRNLESRPVRYDGRNVSMDPMDVKMGEGPARDTSGYLQRGQTQPGVRPPYRGPRPTEQDMTEFERGTGVDRGIPPKENRNLDSARMSSNAYAKRQDRREGHQLKMATHRARMEQAREGSRKAGEEMQDAEQQRLLENFILKRAANAPSSQKPAPPPAPKGPKPLPEMGGEQDRRDMAQAESDAKVVKNMVNTELAEPPGLKPGQTIPKSPGRGGGPTGDLWETMQALLSRNQISWEDFITLMRAKASELGVTNPKGGAPF